jgi:hypothetical protein
MTREWAVPFAATLAVALAATLAQIGGRTAAPVSRVIGIMALAVVLLWAVSKARSSAREWWRLWRGLGCVSTLDLPVRSAELTDAGRVALERAARPWRRMSLLAGTALTLLAPVAAVVVASWPAAEPFELVLSQGDPTDAGLTRDGEQATLMQVPFSVKTTALPVPGEPLRVEVKDPRAGTSARVELREGATVRVRGGDLRLAGYIPTLDVGGATLQVRFADGRSERVATDATEVARAGDYSWRLLEARGGYFGVPGPAVELQEFREGRETRRFWAFSGDAGLAVASRHAAEGPVVTLDSVSPGHRARLTWSPDAIGAPLLWYVGIAVLALLGLVIVRIAGIAVVGRDGDFMLVTMAGGSSVRRLAAWESSALPGELQASLSALRSRSSP